MVVVSDAAPQPGHRYVLDASVQRWGNVVIGGSPLTLFRVTAGGAALLDRIACDEPVPDSPLLDRLLDTGAIHPVPLAGRFSADDVTVVVPTLGSPSHLPADALVVDDGSDPPVEGAAVRLAVNAGPAAARNAGLAHVTTPLVAFVDADVDLPVGWIEPLLGHFDDDRVALVAPRVVTAERPGSIARYERTGSPLDLGAVPARVRAGTRVSYVPAAALVCRADAVRAIGGFDESLRVGEDVDLAWRLDDAGWRCRYDPSVVVEHEPRPSWRGWWRQRVGYGSSAGPLAVRHPGKLAPLRMNGWSVAAWAAVASGHPVTGVAIGAGSAAALVPKLPDVPARESFRLAVVGNLRAGEQIAETVRRAWWPIVAVLAIRSRTARRVLLASFVVARRPIRAADDVAYSIGLWRSLRAARTLDPLAPAISSWPGRRNVRQPPDAAGR